MPAGQNQTLQGGSSLAARLAEPLASTSQLLDLLVPPLHALSLLPDQPSLVQRHASSSAPIEPARFVKRQLGFVQKVLIERVWPDWEAALEAEEGKAALAVFERWFVPPPCPAPAFSSTSLDFGAEVALSAYSVLSSILSSKSTVDLRPRSLEIASQLLVSLSRSFSVQEMYLATVGRPTTPASNAVSDEDDSDDEGGADPASLARWEEAMRNVVSIPTRVANAWGAMQEKQKLPNARPGVGVPPELDLEPYFATLTASYLSLLWHLASSPTLTTSPSALSSPLPSLLSAPSFLATALPILATRFLPSPSFPTPADELLQRHRHIDLWRSVTAELSERDLSRFVRLVLVGLDKELSGSSAPRPQLARGAAFVLDSLFGALSPSNEALWKVAVGVLLERGTSWSGRVVPLAEVLWVGEEETAKVAVMEAVMKTWGAKEELKSASDSRRLYLTSLLLFSAASLPPLHPSIVTLSRSPAFLSAVSTHLSLVAPLHRLLGMLVAEVVSSRTHEPDGEVKPLNFGEQIWAGEEREKVVVRELREAVGQVAEGKRAWERWQDVLRKVYGHAAPQPQPPRPLPPKVSSTPLHPSSVEEPLVPPPKRPLISIIGSDSEDDELEPYPLPPGPSASTLEALSSDDPALYHSAFPSQSAATSGPAGGASQTRKRGRLRPPVYVQELVAYLKGTDPEGGKEEADGEAERVEMGLKEGEALVRRKAGWGGELKENAVDLAFALMALQDQYELDNFDQLRQNILVALVAACPTEVAPAVIEQYFTPAAYSLTQRHTLLASLAFSARELAGLPLPPAPSLPSSSPAAAAPAQPPPPISLFPSKQLPPSMHRRLLGRSSPSHSQQVDQLDSLTSELTRLALSDAREDAEQTVPGAAREKLLNVRRSGASAARNGAGGRGTGTEMGTSASSTPTYATLAAEYFLLPLINRFWLYLRDTSSTLSRPSPSLGSYAGGPPSAPLLDPYLLSKFLATLSVLLHAARHSPAFLAVLVPETLALVMALRPASGLSAVARARRAGGKGDEDEELDEKELNRDAVVSSALELALVALDATVQLDAGRTLMSSSSVNGGSTLVADVKDWAEEVFEEEEQRGGGEAGGVGRSGRAAAGVLLRVEEIVGRWRGSVGW
ncbi:hypothetical protein JCM6882_000928 [Rhodosporidiobolus microsporus]